ncbi:hypothetical protein CBW58_22805 [Yersinia frederiksenii]|nr:hypothetical protein CBW58_22805 [Yersinia frederiksenii]
MRNYQLFLAEHLQFLKRHYDLSGDLLTQKFNKKFGTTKTSNDLSHFKSKYGINVKSKLFEEDLMLQQKIDFVVNSQRLRSGQIATEFEIKYKERISIAAILRIKFIAFGSCGGRRTLPVGTEVLYSNGALRVKVGRPSAWVWKHVETWIREFGPIPDGLSVIAIDGDYSNCEITNLKLMNKSELSYYRALKPSTYPKELLPIIRNIAALKYKVNSINKQKKEPATSEGK